MEEKTPLLQPPSQSIQNGGVGNGYVNSDQYPSLIHPHQKDNFHPETKELSLNSESDVEVLDPVRYCYHSLHVDP